MKSVDCALLEHIDSTLEGNFFFAVQIDLYRFFDSTTDILILNATIEYIQVTKRFKGPLLFRNDSFSNVVVLFACLFLLISFSFLYLVNLNVLENNSCYFEASQFWFWFYLISFFQLPLEYNRMSTRSKFTKVGSQRRGEDLVEYLWLSLLWK